MKDFRVFSAPCDKQCDAPVATDVAKPFTRAMLDQIPIANNNMSIDELRDICVRMMRAQTSFAWTPDADIVYDNRGKEVVLKAGEVIGGMPYITLCQSTLYNIMNFIDERNGLMDVKKLKAAHGGVFERVIANQCSGSTYWAWARISNSVKYNYTKEMFPNRGCLPIGPYHMSSEWVELTPETSTKMVCEANGEQVLFQSYAMMKPGDGVVSWVKGGHVRMVSAMPNVVYNEDGTINAEESTAVMIDQVSKWKDEVQANGKPIRQQGNVDLVWTFAKLFEKSYLPFTIPELAGLAPIDKSEVTCSISENAVNANALKAATVTANYPISFASTAVKDAEGKILYHTEVYNDILNVYENFEIGTYLDAAQVDALANGENTVEICVQIGNGEKPVAYTGKLVANS